MSNFGIIQCKGANARHYQVVRLLDGAYIAPAGYVVGVAHIVFPRLTIIAARRILAVLAGGGTVTRAEVGA